MLEIGVDFSDLSLYYDRRRNIVVGWTGVGTRHPLCSYLKWSIEGSSRIYVSGDVIEIDIDGLTYRHAPSLRIRTFIWRINATIPFGVPVFGGDTFSCF